MQLFKFFLREEIIDPPYVIQSVRDPLSHPAVARMSLMELADLPLNPQSPPRAPKQPSGTRCA